MLSIPRTAQAAPGSTIYHALNRGNGRMKSFRKPEDYLILGLSRPVKTFANLTEGRIVRTFAFLPRRIAFLQREGVGRLAPLGGERGQPTRRGIAPKHPGRMCY